MKTEQAGKKPATPKAKKTPVAKKAAGASVRARNTVKVQQAVVALTDKEQQFVDEYLVDLNGAQAAIRAKYAESSARQTATKLLSKAHIQAAIAVARAKQQQRTEITADRVLREAWNQVTADARELTELIVVCCRHCYGKGHMRQRTQIERDFAFELWCGEGEDPDGFPEDGGVGFEPNREPFENCPDCGGHGYPRVVLKDTRKLSPGAVSLFAGVKQTKFGIEVQTHSKDAAMEKLFKHLGLYEKDNQQRVDPLASLLHGLASGNGNGFKPVSRDPEHGED
ncbi:terminase small subunit [Pseudomonas leptonychotis]|uniref:terminase small subunit n=1 Tax=Pseudomonas leptonychotis TaxID=2448482 RepID=UPI00386B8B91